MPAKPKPAPATIRIARRCTYLIHPESPNAEHPPATIVETDELLVAVPGVGWTLTVTAEQAKEVATFEGGPHMDPYVHADELATFLIECATTIAAGRQAA